MLSSQKIQVITTNLFINKTICNLAKKAAHHCKIFINSINDKSHAEIYYLLTRLHTLNKFAQSAGAVEYTDCFSAEG